MAASGTLRSLNREFAVARRAALLAGDVIQGHRARSIVRCRKAQGELVTAADLEADSVIRELLGREFPADALYTEESAEPAGRVGTARVWIVDPLDGTSDFASGGDEHAVSIGLAVDGRAVLGVVYNPARDELYAGAVGAGVTLNDAPPPRNPPGGRTRITASRKEVKAGFAPSFVVETFSSTAYKLARVAAGLDAAVVSRKRRREWGTCAGVALVASSGRRVTYVDGSDVRFNHLDGRHPLPLLAAAPHVHAWLEKDVLLPASAGVTSASRYRVGEER